MGLPEKVIPRRYHALDNDWTPLSRNPGWLSNAAHRFRHYMKRNRFAWFHRLVTYRQKLLPTNYKLIDDCDKSFADDLVASRYCKHESSLCATICWDFSCVPTICSSFSSNLKAGISFWRSRLFFVTRFFEQLRLPLARVRPLHWLEL